MTRNLKLYFALLTVAAVGFNAMMIAGRGTIELFGGNGLIFFTGGLAVMAGAILLELTDSRRAWRTGRGAVYSISFLAWATLTFLIIPFILTTAGLLPVANQPLNSSEIPLWPAFAALLGGVAIDVYMSKRRVKGMKKEDIFK